MGSDQCRLVLERDLTPAARRQRIYRERQKKYARVATIEVGMETVTALVAHGYLRDGDASQRGLNQAVQRALEALAP